MAIISRGVGQQSTNSILEKYITYIRPLLTPTCEYIKVNSFRNLQIKNMNTKAKKVKNHPHVVQMSVHEEDKYLRLEVEKFG